jgi:hypothetical protein
MNATHATRAVVAGLLLALPAPARDLAGVRMPEHLEVAGKELTLNGMGVRKATFLNVKVYVAGLYLETPSGNPTNIVGSPETKRIVLVFLRDVDRSKMVDTIDEAFRKSAGKNIEALDVRLRQLERMLPNLRERDTLSFTQVSSAPTPAVEVQINGAPKGSIQGDDFARVLWSIWLGKDPPDGDLKKGLLGAH